MSAGRVLEIKKYAAELVKKHDNLTIMIFKITGEKSFDVLGAFYGRNMQKSNFGGVTDLKSLRDFIPDENHVYEIIDAINKTMQTGKITKVNYRVSIGKNSLEDRTLTFLRHDLDIIVAHARREEENNKKVGT